MLNTQKLPKIFTDRSLGNYIIPTKLRESGLDVVTMAEYYGERDSQQMSGDVAWLRLVGGKEWLAFTKDQNIRRNYLEKQIIVEYKVKCFSIANSKDLVGEELADIFLCNLDSIRKVSHCAGPMFYNVSKGRIRKVDLTLNAVR